ncbi:IclR family transcriptional regulator [Bordetella trematum]|uniref:IclR family transcriptional regulator n=1 Tax=Bordetella trematum TaxID=123899 RepID=UPI000C770064|nr:IclR family transcriptional regulator [Bordetella trematum]AUL46288.1 IclR family transcriptional regulator [Bordetella trematum]
MDVKTAGRVLDVLNLFAEEQKPLLYSEIAAQMQIPLSSCHGLLKTMVARGYLYEIGKKLGYYPTQKLMHVASLICPADPLNALLAPLLDQVRNLTGETAILAKLADSQVVYLIVAESRQTIRFSHQPGGFKAVHATSSGKALLAMLSPAERQKWLQGYGELQAYTERTLASRQALLDDLNEGVQRGWQRSVGEHVEDVMSLSLGFRAFEQPFAIVVAGPLGRMLKNEATIGRQLEEVKAWLAQALPSANLTFLEGSSR